MTTRLFLGPRIRESPYFDATRHYGAKKFDVALLQIQGTKSWGVIEKLFDIAVQDRACSECAEIQVGDMPVVESRTVWSAEFGYEIYLRDSARADELREFNMAAGDSPGISKTSDHLSIVRQ